MLTSLSIKNYKSIVDLTLELGRINVFIGENGCGKTNLLEALAMLCAAKTRTLDNEALYNRGVRIAKPSITLSSFQGAEQTPVLELVGHGVEPTDGHPRDWLARLQVDAAGDIYSRWTDVVEEQMDGVGPVALLERVIAQPASIPGVKFTPALLTLFRHALEEEEFKALITSLWTDARQSPLLSNYVIYSLSTQALRGIQAESRREPLGIHGEGLDVLIAALSPEERAQLLQHSHFISWLEDILFDEDDRRKFAGHKLGKSTSLLYFRDRFMALDNNVFSAENANEGVLHVLFYLTLFISKRTPALFAIDNIEQALNPQLCRALMKELALIAAANDKQALITTHNPAILDGINLQDDQQRVFVVSRNDDGHTRARRIKQKEPHEVDGRPLKLSELWMRGFLGGIPKGF